MVWEQLELAGAERWQGALSPASGTEFAKAKEGGDYRITERALEEPGGLEVGHMRPWKGDKVWRGEMLKAMGRALLENQRPHGACWGVKAADPPEKVNFWASFFWQLTPTEISRALSKFLSISSGYPSRQWYQDHAFIWALFKQSLAKAAQHPAQLSHEQLLPEINLPPIFYGCYGFYHASSFLHFDCLCFTQHNRFRLLPSFWLGFHMHSVLPKLEKYDLSSLTYK